MRPACVTPAAMPSAAKRSSGRQLPGGGAALAVPAPAAGSTMGGKSCDEYGVLSASPSA
jgi:hypothetical protein